MKTLNHQPGEHFDRMLTTTTELFYHLEHELLLKPFLSRFADGNFPPAVLDVGSGNGTYLSLVSDSYPNARCIGLEMDNRIFPYAQAKEHKTLRFLPLSYENYEEESGFDLVIVRLSIVHLADRGHFAQWLKRRTKPGSQIVIIDVDDSFEDCAGAGKLPLFHSLYKDARRKLALSRLLHVKDALSLELAGAGFHNRQLHTYQIHGSTLSLKKMMRQYMEVVTLMHGEDPFDIGRSVELDHWMNDNDTSYAIGMFGLVLSV